MRWRLFYAAEVVSYLVALRYAGHELRTDIQQLADEKEPWLSDRPCGGDRFERLKAGHWIGYDTDHENHSIKIVYVKSI